MPITKLRESGFAVTGYFYNPNVHPMKEYLRRREGMQAVAEHLELPMIWDDVYDSTAWIEGAMEHKVDRCGYCYRARLRRCRQVAMAEGFELFSSSLLYSRRQQHEKIRQTGDDLTVEHPANSVSQVTPVFHYQDFRTYWQQGIDMSKELAIYRQNYCGCIFSENERFANEFKKVTANQP